MADELISSRDAAEILHCDIRTVHRWAAGGWLPVAVKVPGYRGGYLFHRDAIEDLADEWVDPDTGRAS